MTWRERIQAARERGEFTPEDMELASSWSTCAVWEQREQYGESLDKAFHVSIPWIPTDHDLRRLGGMNGFHGAVRANNFGRAESLLDAIEDRALQLKRAVTS